MTNEKRPTSWYAWYIFALVLAVAAIILLVLAMKEESAGKQTLLAAGQLCSTTGLVLCLWRNRKNRKKQQ
ncbi:MAG: hypothetical protein ACI4ME_11615 [Aristaeellaceae bacterium]